MPRRIQLKRTKGWRLPANTVKVDRSTPYGNPYRIGPELDRRKAIASFKAYLEKKLRSQPDFLEPLRGRNLACWCRPDELCHADVLLDFANLRYRR
jgi:hypothetical protein